MGMSRSLRDDDQLVASVLDGAPGPHAEVAGAQTARALLDWLAEGRALGASDIHMAPGAPPMLRVNGDLVPSDGAAPLDGGTIADMLKPLVAHRAEWSRFAFEHRDLDVGLELPDLGRVRVHLLCARGEPAAAIRLIPRTIPSLTDLRLPEVTAALMQRRKGLWVFTGATGSGKSTTQAAIVRAILEDQPRRVMTLEDPIEYVHCHGRGLISQREIGLDTRTFDEGLTSAMREDPDVILVGEMRDLETIRQALRAAETGHLVLTTLHTVDATQAIDRIVDVFPASQQEQIRIQLSDVLLAVYAHQLVKTGRTATRSLPVELRGRVAAIEVLLGPMAELYPTRALIRHPRPGALYTLMEQTVDAGCQTMERALLKLVRAGMISEAEARSAAVYREGFERLANASGSLL